MIGLKPSETHPNGARAQRRKHLQKSHKRELREARAKAAREATTKRRAEERAAAAAALVPVLFDEPGSDPGVGGAP